MSAPPRLHVIHRKRQGVLANYPNASECRGSSNPLSISLCIANTRGIGQENYAYFTCSKTTTQPMTQLQLQSIWGSTSRQGHAGHGG